MHYLLDTDTLVYFLRGRPEVTRRLFRVAVGDLCTSIMCFGELCYGAAKSQEHTKRKTEVDRLRQALKSVPLESAVMERFGLLKASLEARGERLADADLLITASTLENDLTLVTGNLKHFQRIEGLRIENWIER